MTTPNVPQPVLTKNRERVTPAMLAEVAQSLVTATDALSAVNAYKEENASNCEDMIEWALERANLAVWQARWVLGISHADQAFEPTDAEESEPNLGIRRFTATQLEHLKGMLDTAHFRVFHAEPKAREGERSAIEELLEAALYRAAGTTVLKVPLAPTKPVTPIPGIEEAPAP